MQVYLISLQKDELRREALKNRFKSYDNFKIINGVDARDFSLNEYYKIALKSFMSYKRLLSPAEIGCALSHKKAYAEFLKSGDDFGLIFEDDVIGDDFGIKKASDYAKLIPKDAILILGGQDGLDGRFSAFGKRIKDELFLVSKHSFGSIYRAACYIVTKQSASALLKTQENAPCTADLWSYLLSKDNLKMYFADIFAHPTDLSTSNLEGERLDRTALYKIGFKEYLRTLKFLLFSRFEAVFLGYEKIFKK